MNIKNRATNDNQNKWSAVTRVQKPTPAMFFWYSWPWPLTTK